jgi:hypothetical protein
MGDVLSTALNKTNNLSTDTLCATSQPLSLILTGKLYSIHVTSLPGKQLSHKPRSTYNYIKASPLLEAVRSLGLSQFWTLFIIRSKCDISETGFCLHLQAEDAQLLLTDRTSLFLQTPASQVKVLRLMISRPACPGVRPPSGTHGKLFFCLKLSLDSYEFVIMGCPL